MIDKVILDEGVKDQGILKWQEALNIIEDSGFAMDSEEMILDAISWWDDVGATPCSYCRQFASYADNTIDCHDCPLNDKNRDGHEVCNYNWWALNQEREELDHGFIEEYDFFLSFKLHAPKMLEAIRNT